jgi:hypothetical protein
MAAVQEQAVMAVQAAVQVAMAVAQVKQHQDKVSMVAMVAVHLDGQAAAVQARLVKTDFLPAHLAAQVRLHQ